MNRALALKFILFDIDSIRDDHEFEDDEIEDFDERSWDFSSFYYGNYGDYSLDARGKFGLSKCLKFD